ncbi:hypothetical protein [Alkalihalobacillus sp. AL-G]|uniref:hypothetical protein n=1 Tax=Alkalihalobacillus sp. AL-G TaxID=2926399 RepID=UPI00351B7B6C
MHVTVLLWLLFQNIKKETWKQYKTLYSSVCYVMSFNLLFYFLRIQKLPWDFKSSYFKTKTLRVLHLFLVTPLLIFSYLSTYPKTLFKQTIYIIKWVSFSSLIEVIALTFKAISYKGRWNIGWSVLIYFLMFLFSKSIQKKPVFTIALSVLTTILLDKIFHPLEKGEESEQDL